MPHPALREVLDLLGDRWTAAILDALNGAGLRYHELERQLPGASRRMISRTLRTLERNGLVERTVNTRPIQVHYELTDLGSSLTKQLRPLQRWARHNHPHILAAREADGNGP